MHQLLPDYQLVALQDSTRDMWEGSRFPSFKREITCFFFVGFWREYDVHKFSPNSPERNGWIVLKYVESFYTHTPIYEHLRAQTRARISQIYPYFTHLCEKQTVQRCAHPHVYRGVYIYIYKCIIYMYIYILWCFYHRWIVAIGLYIIYIYMYYAIGSPPHIYIYILCNYSIYNMLSGSPPYVYILYIYILSYRVTHTYTHTYIYIYTLNPTTLPLSHHSSNSRLLLLLAAATPLKRWRRCRPQQTFQFVIYIYIYISGLSFKWDIQDWWEI